MKVISSVAAAPPLPAIVMAAYGKTRPLLISVEDMRWVGSVKPQNTEWTSYSWISGETRIAFQAKRHKAHESSETPRNCKVRDPSNHVSGNHSRGRSRESFDEKAGIHLQNIFRSSTMENKIARTYDDQSKICKYMQDTEVDTLYVGQ